jgi:hypothetical protein
MSETPRSAVEGERDLPASLCDGVYQYFFYGWLFRDADSGSGLERATALQHNRDQAKWLPVYMVRWVIGGAVIVALEALCEHALSSPLLSAAFAVALTLVVLFLLITVVCWSFLQGAR